MLFKGFTNIKKIFTGNSIVYSARKESNNSKVIIKFVPLSIENEKQIEQLKFEYAILSPLKNSGILNIVSFNEIDSGYFMVMEDTGSQSLKQWLSTNKPSLEDFFYISKQLIDIIDYIHQKQIVHKDIQPDNIIINPKTLKVHIIDFGISSLISNELVEVEIPQELEGNLTYISPEQTGRISKTVDFRSDFYSLGLTFYEILTCQVLLKSSDPMELIHGHIAKQIVFPTEVVQTIPLSLQQVILKLIEKDKNSRYQSCIGIESDLNTCQEMIKKGDISSFKTGQNDFIPYLIIPEKLFGRQNELNIMKKSILHCAMGTEEITYISGASGTGKTALVNEIRANVTAVNGYFVKGKYEQLQTDILFYGISQSLNSLVRLILCESTTIVNEIKETLITDLGENLSLITTIVPDLEYLVGKQKHIVDIKGKEALNRFIITLHNFLQILASKNHPLVLVLDDLQWADQASLDTMFELTKLEPINYFYFIGIYRDDEITIDHPYMKSKAEMDKYRESSIINLNHLEKVSITNLLKETFNSDSKDLVQLSDLIFEKTMGNPFYIKKLLKSLYKKGLISFCHKKNIWDFNLNKITKENISINVIEFLIDTISKLSKECQKLLSVASCIGTKFSVEEIEPFISNSNIGIMLEEAINSDLIIPTNNKYRRTFFLEGKDRLQDVTFKFIHDKIQQASYSQSTEFDKNRIHLDHGYFLLKKYNNNQDRRILTSLLYHINKVEPLIENKEERRTFANLNFEAGAIARISTAYTEASLYFKNGLNFISFSSWKDDYELFRELTIGNSECSFIYGNKKLAEEMILIALKNANNNVDILKFTVIRVEQYVSVGKLENAINIGLVGLSRIGIKIPPNPSMALILFELFKTKINLGSRSIKDLEYADELTDELSLQSMTLSLSIVLAAYLQGRESLFTFLIFRIVNIALKKGNCPISIYGYSTFGIMLGSALGNYKNGWEYGQLSKRLMIKYPNAQLDGRIQHAYTDFIFPWKYHWKEISEQLIDGVRRSYRSGDMVYASYMAQHMYLWDPTINVKDLLKLHAKNISFIKGTGYKDSLNEGLINYNFYNNLNGKTENAYSFNTNKFNEDKCKGELEKTGYNTGLAVLYLRKAEMYCFYGEYIRARDYIILATPIMASVLGLPYVVRFAVISIITHNRLLSVLKRDDLKNAHKLIKKEFGKITKWSKYNPDSFLHLYKFLNADIKRFISGKKNVLKEYLEGISLSKKNNWILDKALFLSLVGEYSLSNNEPIAASGYFLKSYTLFNNHSCFRVTQYLEDRYGEHLILSPSNSIKKLNNITDDSGLSGKLDILTIMKSTSIISEEIILEPLIKKIMGIVIENAGADKGIFIKNNDGLLTIMAEISTNKMDVYTKAELPVLNSNLVPEKLVNYVFRSETEIIFNETDDFESYLEQDYFNNNNIKSILCLPLIRNNKIYGILYLENSLTSGAFSFERIDIIKILLSQIIISLENAQLYRSLENYNLKLEEEVKKRTNELETLAMTDPLTKLMNRRAMADKMEHELIRYYRTKESFILIICDIDNFKNFNDKYGHDCGDIVLKRVSKILLTNVREQDQVARWGGEEFLIMLPDTTVQGGVVLAEKLRVAINSDIISFDEDKVNISMTFGGGSISENKSIENTIKVADESLYKGKKHGRNCVVFIES